MAEPMKTEVRSQLRQELHLTPRLLQSMEVLQMNAQDISSLRNMTAQHAMWDQTLEDSHMNLWDSADITLQTEDLSCQ